MKKEEIQLKKCWDDLRQKEHLIPAIKIIDDKGKVEILDTLKNFVVSSHFLKIF